MIFYQQNEKLLQDKEENSVCREPLIHSDGTGYISEDLALKCPKNVFKGSVVNGDNVEVGYWGLDLLPVIHLVRNESIAEYLPHNSSFWCA